MTRLIDADAFTIIKVKTKAGGKTVFAEVLQKVLDTAPTVDAEPVKRGMWTVIRLTNKDYDAKECSSCGSTFFNTVLWHYCPNCGARMGND